MCRSLLALAIVSTAYGAGPLDGQVGLITGASSGIGKVVAVELAQAGMKVLLTARRMSMLEDAVAEIKSAGGEAIAAMVDVSKPETIDAAFALAESTYGKVDFVFANAGVEGQFQVPLEEQDPSNEKFVFDVNVAGATISTLRCAVRAFKKHGGGTIVFSSSLAALLNSNSIVAAGSNFIAYAASKAAIDAVVRFAHGAYATDNIRVYGLNIAVFASEMSARAPGGAMGIVGFNPYFKTSVGNPVEIARVIAALLDGTSLWPPGSLIVIDNDATFDAQHFYDLFFKPGPPELVGFMPPQEVKPLLRDVKGGAYAFAKEEL
jgi:NAD(P)-dependent dehydrogenase (short-subunit alcohol dehydrogenase family)